MLSLGPSLDDQCLFLELNWTGGNISLQICLFSTCSNVSYTVDDPLVLKYIVHVPLLSLPDPDHQPILSCKPIFIFLFWEVIKITIQPLLSNSWNDFILLLSNSFHFSFIGLPIFLAFAGLIYLIRVTNVENFYRELNLICLERFICYIWHLKQLIFFGVELKLQKLHLNFWKKLKQKLRSSSAENIFCKRKMNMWLIDQIRRSGKITKIILLNLESPT
jgi:hypothetical protein